MLVLRRVVPFRQGTLRRLSFVVRLIVLLLLVLPAAPAIASAHSSGPARTIPVAAGAYRLVVSLYDDPPRAGTVLHFSVDPAPGTTLPAGQMQITATAVPGAGVNAVPVRGTTSAHADAPGGVAGQVRLVVAGAWTLRLEIQGPLGTAQTAVPLRAAPPVAIPTWLGWAIGLVPIWGMLGFILAQAVSAWRAGGLPVDPPVRAGTAGASGSSSRPASTGISSASA